MYFKQPGCECEDERSPLCSWSVAALVTNLRSLVDSAQTCSMCFDSSKDSFVVITSLPRNGNLNYSLK